MPPGAPLRIPPTNYELLGALSFLRVTGQPVTLVVNTKRSASLQVLEATDQERQRENSYVVLT